MEGEETYDLSFLGQADEVVVERIAQHDVIMIKGTKTLSSVCYLTSFIFRQTHVFVPIKHMVTKVKAKHMVTTELQMANRT